MSPPPYSSPRPRYGRMVLIWGLISVLLCTLSFLTYFDRVCIMRAAGDIQADLNISDEQMGLIFGAFWLAYALFEIPGGWLGDRFGARQTLTRIVLAWSLFTVLTGSATGFYSLILYRFLFGVGEAGAYPNMARVQKMWLPARLRALFGGLLWLMARFGGAFSPLIFGWLLFSFNSPEFRDFLGSMNLPSDIPAWRVAFWAAGLVGVVWCLAFYPWFRDDPAKVSSINEAELRVIRGGGAAATGPEKHSMPGHVWKALLLSPSLWAMGMLYVCGSFGWSFFVSWMPRFLKDVHGVAYEKSELMAGLPLFFGGLSCLLGGVLCDAAVWATGYRRLCRALFPMIGYTTAAAAMYCVRFAETAHEASVLMCVAAGAFDFGQGANWASIIDIGGRYAGTATGFVNMVGNAGNYLQPVIGAIIFNRLGWNFLFAVYAAAFLGAALMWLFINPNRTFYGEPALVLAPPPKDRPRHE